MAVAYTASIASGNLTNVIYFSNGPQTVMQGHYSAPSAATGIIETGMFRVDYYDVQDADPACYKLSANSNGTYAVLFSGHAAGSTGMFEIKGS